MFRIHTTDAGNIPGIEYIPCGAIAPKVGQALYMDGGVLALATGTTKPTYVSMCERETACTAGDLIPVVRVNADMIFATTFSASASSVKPGMKVTIATTGDQVTATTTDGIAEVVSMDGNTAGAGVLVRFA
jgi:uncharacterized protein YwbE